MNLVTTFHMLLQVPCDLDPFCDDPDDPLEVPLDNGAILLLFAVLLLFLWRRRERAKALTR